MQSDRILVSISPNEENSKERVKDLVQAIESFKGQFIHISDDPKQPSDICMKTRDRQIHVEVKDTNQSNDLWGSKQGHIGDQLISLIDEHSEAFIAVLGNFDEVRQEVPHFTNQGGRCKYAGRDLQESNKTTLRALNADAYGCGIPIFYLSKDRVLSFKEILSYGKNRLCGANPFQWASTFKGRAGKIQALRGAKGIGVKNAEMLLDHFGSIKHIANANYEDLKELDGIGPTRAIAIMELFR